MSNPSTSNIQFESFSVRESHIKFNEPGKYKINIQFTPKGYIFINLNQFHLKLDVNIKDAEDKFEIKLSTISVFTYPEEASVDEYKQSLFILNAPAIVFPYIRAYISSLTALSGMPTLTLPTLNMANLGEELKANLSEVLD
ncbi:protein export chaperone secb [Maribacter algicola]|uniref:Protein export chaperone secb n=1 Tax=Maribacter algicola TaxID=2498892 RepID=A0A3R8RPE4_9FLAO|nr:protein-export chaperone SecB [Maribacter algicola]RRQ49799.1 protein export chaperone secb [Maribacter algicola]